jgi:hypothetical protein
MGFGRLVAGAMALLTSLSAAGCSALTPQAVAVIFPADVAATLVDDTLDNPPGHVVLIFINNTRFDGNTRQYLQDQGVDVEATDAPRVRFRVNVSFSTGTSNAFEFVNGSDAIDTVIEFEDEEGNIIVREVSVPPDLIENDLENFVVICDVAGVDPVTPFTSSTSPIDMFVPTFLKEITVVRSEFGITQRELVTTVPPGFVPLLVDEVDETGAITLQRNFGTRDIPGFPNQLFCGAVVTFVLSGDLTLPFVVDETDTSVPGYLDTDVNAQAAIPGRFRLTVDVR